MTRETFSPNRGLPDTTLAAGPAVFHNSTRMPVALVRYDAARRALAAAHRVDEVKHIHDKATALLAYAKQAGDFELQNKAAEIRLFAERRAGELLVDMQATGQRHARERGRPAKASSPTTLPKLGITRDQSSKWQRLAKMIDDATFEKALIQAKDKYGELTTAAVLREIKEIVKPASGVVEPNINVIAAELTRDLTSAGRKEKLEEVVRLRNRLNPTIRKHLISALRSAASDASDFEEKLTGDFQQLPSNGMCHQRVVREQMAGQTEPDLEEKRKLAGDLKNAVVREISYEQARQVVLSNEYLASMGTTEFAYGLFFGRHLAGVSCFGRTAGTQVASSICGSEHAHKVATLCRGACCWWTPKNAASFLINAACSAMSKTKGYNIFVAYSDPDAGEIGTVYQASNWLYCGTTNPTEKFRTPSGEVKDARLVSAYSRDRTGGTLKYKRSRAEQKQMMMEEGNEFFREENGKHRYVGIYGDRRIKRILRGALKWEVLPYPKRVAISEGNAELMPNAEIAQSASHPISSSRPLEHSHPVA